MAVMTESGCGERGGDGDKGDGGLKVAVMMEVTVTAAQMAVAAVSKG